MHSLSIVIVIDSSYMLISNPVERVRAKFHQFGHAPKRKVADRLLLLLFPGAHEFFQSVVNWQAFPHCNYMHQIAAGF